MVHKVHRVECSCCAPKLGFRDARWRAAIASPVLGRGSASMRPDDDLMLSWRSPSRSWQGRRMDGFGIGHCVTTPVDLQRSAPQTHAHPHHPTTTNAKELWPGIRLLFGACGAWPSEARLARSDHGSIHGIHAPASCPRSSRQAPFGQAPFHSCPRRPSPPPPDSSSAICTIPFLTTSLFHSFVRL